MSGAKDMFGNPIERGDYVAIPDRRASILRMDIGRVLEADEDFLRVVKAERVSEDRWEVGTRASQTTKLERVVKVATHLVPEHVRSRLYLASGVAGVSS